MPCDARDWFFRPSRSCSQSVWDYWLRRIGVCVGGCYLNVFKWIPKITFTIWESILARLQLICLWARTIQELLAATGVVVVVIDSPLTCQVFFLKVPAPFPNGYKGRLRRWFCVTNRLVRHITAHQHTPASCQRSRPLGFSQLSVRRTSFCWRCHRDNSVLTASNL